MTYDKACDAAEMLAEDLGGTWVVIRRCVVGVYVYDFTSDMTALNAACHEGWELVTSFGESEHPLDGVGVPAASLVPPLRAAAVEWIAPMPVFLPPLATIRGTYLCDGS